MRPRSPHPAVLFALLLGLLLQGLAAGRGPGLMLCIGCSNGLMDQAEAEVCCEEDRADAPAESPPAPQDGERRCCIDVKLSGDAVLSGKAQESAGADPSPAWMAWPVDWIATTLAEPVWQLAPRPTASPPPSPPLARATVLIV